MLKLLLIPYILSSIIITYRAFKGCKPYSHDRMETLMGVGIIIMISAMLNIAIDYKDYLAIILFIIGTIVSIYFEKKHLIGRNEHLRILQEK